MSAGKTLRFEGEMRLFIRLFLVVFLCELSLYGVAAISHTDHPLVYFPIIPAIWVAMAIGGVHSAGFLSCVVGLAVTALVYSLVTSALVWLTSKVLHRDEMLTVKPDKNR